MPYLRRTAWLHVCSLFLHRFKRIQTNINFPKVALELGIEKMEFENGLVPTGLIWSVFPCSGQGWTPLHWAQMGHEATAQALVRANALRTKTNSGRGLGEIGIDRLSRCLRSWLFGFGWRCLGSERSLTSSPQFQFLAADSLLFFKFAVQRVKYENMFTLLSR